MATKLISIMKKVFLFLAIVYSGMLIQAQEKCADAVHPTESRKSILNCCIKDIKDGNVVVYTKGRKTYEIEAVAINYNGEYGDLTNDNSSIRSKVLADNNPDNLYKGHNCDYYNNKYRQGTTQKWAGVILTSCGLGIAIAGGIYGANQNLDVLGTSVLSGFVISSAGAALWISGGIKRTKNNKALEECKRTMNLSLGTTNNGVGLVLNF